MPPVDAPSVAGGEVRRRRSHRFLADKDDAMLRKAFRASLTVTAPGRASVRIVNDGTGHHLPSGGNWLTVRFSALDGSGGLLRERREAICRAEAVLLDFWPFAEDSRIPADAEREVPFDLPEGHGTVEAVVTYHDWHGVKMKLLTLREAY